MEFGILILVVIIVIDVLAMVFVMWAGSRHDHHNEVRNIESSTSLARLQQKGIKLVTGKPDQPAEPAAE